MADMIKFYKGALANLPVAGASGALYITSDEGAIYLGTGTGMKRLGDFIQVDAVANLPVDGANTSALYYCVAENILCRYDSTNGWVQINKQKTLAELGGVAKSTYDTKMAALEKADSDNADAIAGVDTRLQAAEEKLKSVATTDGLAELAEAVAGHTAAIDTINGTVETEGSMLKIAKDAADSKDAAIQAAQKAADDAQSDVDTLAQTHATDKKNLEDAIALKANTADVYNKSDIDGKVDTINESIATKANATDVYTKTAVDGMVENLEAADQAINDKIGAVPADSTVMAEIAKAQTAATYDDSEVRGLISDNADAIQAIANDYLKASDKTELEDAIDAKADQTALDAEIQRATGVEGGLATRIKAVEDDYLKAADKTELQGNINTLTGVVETLRDGIDADKVDGVIDLINYVEAHGAEVTGMKEDIAANAKAIGDEATRADEAEKALSGRIDTLSDAVDTKAAASDLTALDGRVEVVEGKVSTLEGEMDAVEKKAADNAAAIEALQGASATHATKDELSAVSAVAEAAVTVAEMNAAISAAGHAAQTDLDTHVNNADVHVTTADKAKWNGAQSAAEATAAAALATARTEITEEIATAKSEAVAAAKTETESQVAAEAAIARAAEQANAKAISDEVTARGTAVSGVQTALDNYKISNDAAVAGKADKATTLAGYGITDAMTATEIIEMFTWSEF